MTKASNIFALAGFTLVALFYVLTIYEGPLGHSGDYYFHGIVILIGTLGFVLAGIAVTIGTASMIWRTLGVICIILSVFLFISIFVALFVYPAYT